MQTSEAGGGIYWLGFLLTALPTFLGCWAYAIYEYGFLLGGGLGWFPSGLIAVVAGFLWPLILLGGLVLWAIAK